MKKDLDGLRCPPLRHDRQSPQAHLPLSIRTPPSHNSSISLALSRQRLRELALPPDRRSAPVEDEHRDRDDESNDAENGRRPSEAPFALESRVERIGVECCNTGQDITGETVAARGRGGVGSVGGAHVVDRGHVHGVICHADH